MKYYHIIYNSSEKPMEGGVGFGIRTATEGTPQGVLKVISDSNIFSDDWETYENKPTPAQMKDDPSTIESVPKNYAVTVLNDAHENSFTVIARRAYVGFDYGFYKNGLPTRPGNYVIDYYVFETTPEVEAYEILYENAKEGSNHFIPKSVRPVESNEEMREISLGSQPPLPLSGKPFTAIKADALDPDTVKLFFCYFKARNEGKKLVVRTSPQKALKLTADLYRMLTPETAKEIRTYINLRSQGTNENFDIFFIHEDYPHPIYEALYEYVEIDSAPMPSIDEAKTFGDDLSNYVSNSFSANKSDIDDTLKWILLPEYQTVKRMSKLTIDSFFLYCIQPGNFFYANLMDGAGKNLNEEFLKILCDYSRKSPKNAERLNLILTEKMKEATAENIISLIEQYNRLLAIGFNLDQVTDQVKKHICAVILSNIDLFKKTLDTIGYAGLEKFFVKSIFEEHASYVDSNVLDPYMLKLYKWFLPKEELQKRNNMLFSHFFKRDMESKTFVSIMDDVYGNDNVNKTKFFREILAKDLKPCKIVWPFLKHYLEMLPSTPDFLEEFKGKINLPDYASLFYYSIVKNKPLYGNVDGIMHLTKALEQNSQLKHRIAENYETDQLYESFYNQIKQNCTKGDPKKALDNLNNCVLKFLPGVNDQKMSILADYLTIITSGNLKHIDGFSGERLNLLLQEVVDQHDVKLFHVLLPANLAAAKAGDISPQLLASKYREYNPEAKTIDMVNALLLSEDWIEMLDAIIVKTNKLSFKDALQLCNERGLDSRITDQFLERCYRKDFQAYKLRMKIQRFFSSVKKLFDSKNRKDNSLKEKKVDNTKTKKTDKSENKISPQK